MIVVDASVWVSNALPYDEFHRPSRTWLDGLVSSGEPLGGPTLVLAEVSGAIARRSGNAGAAHAAIRRFRMIPNLVLRPVDSALVEDATRLAADLGLRGADAVYVALAARLGCPLVTWDNEMVRKTTDVVDVRQPTA